MHVYLCHTDYICWHWQQKVSGVFLGNLWCCWFKESKQLQTLKRLDPLTVALTCFEAELVLLLAVVVVQRFHSHTFDHIFVERVRSSVGVVAWVRGCLVLVRPLCRGRERLVLLVAADTKDYTSQSRCLFSVLPENCYDVLIPILLWLCVCFMVVLVCVVCCKSFLLSLLIILLSYYSY